MVTVAVSINIRAPRVASRIVAHTLHATFAVAPNTMMPSCFFLADDLQVFASAIQTVVIGKYNFEAWWCRHDLPMEINQSISTVYFGMTNCVALLTVAFAPVAPAELGKKWIIGIVNEDELIG